MDNFTTSTEDINGITFYTYTGDRKRGGASHVFFNRAPTGTSYSGTWHTSAEDERPLSWPKYLETLSDFDGLHIHHALAGDDVKVLSETELDASQETALDNAYDNHVAPA